MSKSQNTETELSVLKEILKWTRFSGMREVKEIISSVLDDDLKRKVYQLSDGLNGSTEICHLTGIKSPTTITKYWGSWTKLGLGEKIPVSGGERFKRSFDLEDFGYAINASAEVGSQGQTKNSTEQHDQNTLTETLGPSTEEGGQRG